MIASIVVGVVLSLGRAGPSLDTSVEVARAEGDRIIAAAGAGDVFENITEDGTTRLRHKASGMVCGFEPRASGNAVHVYPQSHDKPRRGDDVSCANNAGASYTRYATRYRSMPTPQQDLANAVAGIRRNWTNVEPLDVSFDITPVAGRQMPIFAAMKGVHPNGTDAATFILITHLDGWSFKVRASGLVSDAQDIALIADHLASTALPPHGRTGH